MSNLSNCRARNPKYVTYLNDDDEMQKVYVGIFSFSCMVLSCVCLQGKAESAGAGRIVVEIARTSSQKSHRKFCAVHMNSPLCVVRITATSMSSAFG